jgi:hypothetical protein
MSDSTDDVDHGDFSDSIPPDGLSLRDHFAANAQDIYWPPRAVLESLTGRDRPDDTPGNAYALTRWLMEADAALRYLFADAMIWAREIQR